MSQYRPIGFFNNGICLKRQYGLRKYPRGPQGYEPSHFILTPLLSYGVKSKTTKSTSVPALLFLVTQFLCSLFILY